MAKGEPKRFEGYMLVRSGKSRDLDGYIFANEGHARTWMRGPFERGDKSYSLVIISYRKRKCCGEAYAIKQLKRVDLHEFFGVPREPMTIVPMYGCPPMPGSARDRE